MDYKTLIATLKMYKIPYSSEQEMQEALCLALEAEKIPFEREFRLSDKDRVDFLTKAGIAIECKVKGSALTIHRQIERYAKHDIVTGIILFTAYHMGSLETIEGKPVTVIKPGVAWL